MVFGRHALLKMHRDDIDEQEVLEALEAPRSQHFFNSKHETRNVTHRVSTRGRMLLVAYEERTETLIVVTSHWTS